MANVVPDTENFYVAALAVAWEIVKANEVATNGRAMSDSSVKKMTDAVIEVYQSIIQKQHPRDQKLIV